MINTGRHSVSKPFVRKPSQPQAIREPMPIKLKIKSNPVLAPML
jgi:hypothetical protein